MRALLPRAPTPHAPRQAPLNPSDETPGPHPVDPLSTADNLVIAGNVIVNHARRGAPMDLGLEACVDANPTCNTSAVSQRALGRRADGAGRRAAASGPRRERARRAVRTRLDAQTHLAGPQHISRPPFRLPPAQVTGANALNPGSVPKVSFAGGKGSLRLSPESRAAVAAAWRRVAPGDFPAWATPLVTPAGALGNAVPLDKTGAARSASADMVGAFL
jgi:hypothetical protein